MGGIKCSKGPTILMWINGIRVIKLLGEITEVGTMHINAQDPDSFTYDGSDALEKIIGVAMAQCFSVRDGFKLFC